VNLSLDPAAVLYLKKLAVRKREDITSHAIPLPGVTWAVQKARLPGVSDKDLAKNLMRSLAAAWRATLPSPSATDPGFVALIKVTSTVERFEFQVHCPFPKVVASISDPAARKALADNSVAIGIDIQYKFALIGERCPVVFMWQPKTHDMLITNQFHLANAKQFIAIDRVGTTSGFLNFIGAQLLLQASDEEDAGFLSRLPALLKEGMVARADEWLRWVFHQAEQRVIFDSKRILVDQRHPESYFYDYSPQTV
jgi:hypothetical protein